MLDYLMVYHTEQGFDLPSLLNDDYFRAIKLLYNNKHYVSAMKLLMSFLDTVGYLEFGDRHGNFLLWLAAYADLSQVGVTAEELWELRNSLLHMTNLDSRKVKARKVQRLLFYVGIPPSDFPTGDEEGKYFGLWQFIQCILEAMSRYCASFNAEPSKSTTFFKRYDRIISDTRYFKIHL